MSIVNTVEEAYSSLSRQERKVALKVSFRNRNKFKK